MGWFGRGGGGGIVGRSRRTTTSRHDGGGRGDLCGVSCLCGPARRRELGKVVGLSFFSFSGGPFVFSLWGKGEQKKKAWGLQKDLECWRVGLFRRLLLARIVRQSGSIYPAYRITEWQNSVNTLSIEKAVALEGSIPESPLPTCASKMTLGRRPRFAFCNNNRFISNSQWIHHLCGYLFFNRVSRARKHRPNPTVVASRSSYFPARQILCAHGSITLPTYKKEADTPAPSLPNSVRNHVSLARKANPGIFYFSASFFLLAFKARSQRVGARTCVVGRCRSIFLSGLPTLYVAKTNLDSRQPSHPRVHTGALTRTCRPRTSTARKPANRTLLGSFGGKARFVVESVAA